MNAMTPTPCEVAPDETLRHAAEVMRDLNVPALPVCEKDELVGMITEHDIAVRAVADGRDPNRCKVRDAMTWQLYYVDEGGC